MGNSQNNILLIEEYDLLLKVLEAHNLGHDIGSISNPFSIMLAKTLGSNNMHKVINEYVVQKRAELNIDEDEYLFDIKLGSIQPAMIPYDDFSYSIFQAIQNRNISNKEFCLVMEYFKLDFYKSFFVASKEFSRATELFVEEIDASHNLEKSLKFYERAKKDVGYIDDLSLRKEASPYVLDKYVENNEEKLSKLIRDIYLLVENPWTYVQRVLLEDAVYRHDFEYAIKLRNEIKEISERRLNSKTSEQ